MYTRQAVKTLHMHIFTYLLDTVMNLLLEKEFDMPLSNQKIIVIHNHEP